MIAERIRDYALQAEVKASVHTFLALLCVGARRLITRS
jgi:hypothetical protein